MLFEYDGSVPLDTAGWPTNGGIGPGICPPDLLADEDGDARDDACDNCPLDPNDQTDTDRDGIGDPCDPHPMFAIERRVLFDGFNTDAGIGIALSGNWTVSGGLLRQTGIGIGRQLYAITAGAWREPTLQVRFENVRKNGTVLNFVVGAYLISAGEPSTVYPDGVQCRVYYGGSSNLQMQRIRDEVPFGALSSAAILRVTDDVSMQFASAKGYGSPPECAGVRDTQPPNALTTQLLLAEDATDPEPATFALWTSSARADFEAIVIYETTYP